MNRDIANEIESAVVPDRAIAVWALGQCGFVLKSANCTVGIDLYLSDSVNEKYGAPWSRTAPPPIAPEALPPLDAVLCTHHHEDHMDEATLRALRTKAATTFVAPRAHLPLMRDFGLDERRLAGMNHGETLQLPGVEIKAFAAMHDTFEQDEAGNHRFLGYTLRFDGGYTVYHAGDTIGFPELPEWIRPERVDAAFVPINGRDYRRTAANIVGNMNYREAADLAADIDAGVVVPMHYGIFRHNDENPAYFVDYVYQTYPELPFRLPRLGERFILWK